MINASLFGLRIVFEFTILQVSKKELFIVFGSVLVQLYQSQLLFYFLFYFLFFEKKVRKSCEALVGERFLE